MTHPVDEHVGARLRQLRKEAGMSQEALGTRLGITFQQVQKYERGTNRVSASKLHEAAQALGVSIADFFEGLPANGGAGDSPADVGMDKELRQLVRFYKGVSPAARRRLVDLAEVIARPAE